MTNSFSNYTDQARSLLEQSKEILIVLPTNPTFDSVAGALSLYLGLSSRGMQVNISCPDQMTVEFSHLVGVDKVLNNITGNHGKNLVISFPYQEGSIEKVSYNIENDTFNLVIEPREGYPMVTSDVIRFSNSGGNTDLIITIGVSRLTDLNQIYSNNQELFAQKPVLNIDTNNQNTKFGRINIIDPNISSVSELIYGLFVSFGFQINADIATNLLAGITSGTENFNSSLTQASTYEIAATCLRSGARKIGQAQSLPKSIRPPQQVNMPSFNKPAMTTPKFQTVKPRTFQPQPHQQTGQKGQTNEAPPDWLKPKIFKGSTLL